MQQAAPEASGLFPHSNGIVVSLAISGYTSDEIIGANKNAMEVADESMALPDISDLGGFLDYLFFFGSPGRGGGG
jgi:hypothetical protein